MKNSNQKDFDKLVGLVETLSGPKGCPWDREQTIKTLKKDLMSEAKEVALAIDNEDYKNLKEELGDLLWAIVFMAQIAKEKKLFNVEDILREVKAKMIRRHPHVFGDKKAATPADAKRFFNEMKQKEKEHKSKRKK